MCDFCDFAIVGPISTRGALSEFLFHCFSLLLIGYGEGKTAEFVSRSDPTGEIGRLQKAQRRINSCQLCPVVPKLAQVCPL